MLALGLLGQRVQQDVCCLVPVEALVRVAEQLIQSRLLALKWGERGQGQMGWGRGVKVTELRSIWRDEMRQGRGTNTRPNITNLTMLYGPEVLDEPSVDVFGMCGFETMFKV